MATEWHDPMLDASEVASMFGIAERTLREWTKTGAIVAPYRFGRTPKWRQSELNQWAQTRNQK
ncbi:helix-turn-helix transcriptional regulator [Paraburkholderia rhynchosiae]|nr:helix-turn-helix domain-containing protein [Paraburkholderia rhynchosiae]CAB3645590.1 hypothetical protein LMG27174_00826 [Paraburkholderia rhynchosiae]